MFLTCFFVVERRLRKRKVLPEPNWLMHSATLIYVSLALGQTPTDAATPRSVACPFTPQRSMLIIMPTQEGMARLSWPTVGSWLHTEIVSDQSQYQPSPT